MKIYFHSCLLLFIFPKYLFSQFSRLSLIIITLLTCNFIICASQNTSAQTNLNEYRITGTIKDEKNEALPGALISVVGTQSGAVSGADGRFQLKINGGKINLLIRLIGYDVENQEFILSKDTQLNIILKESPVELGTVYVTPDGKDPAYRIIAAARDNRNLLKKTAPNYIYKAYTKTRIELLDVSKTLTKLSKDLSKLDTGATILYLSENFSDVSVAEPNDIKEIITASRVSGNKDRYSLFSSLFTRFDLNENHIKLDGISDRGYISPISDNTFLYYNFKLQGQKIENLNGKKLIYHKIDVIPKRKRDPVFHGTIWIVDSIFAVSGFDLKMNSEQANFIDTMQIRSTSLPIRLSEDPNSSGYDEYGWKSGSVRFDFTGNSTGIKFGGYSLSMLSGYSVKKEFPPKTFSNEKLIVSDTSLNKGEEFWNQSRPTPLENRETRDYQVRDSLEIYKNSPKYLDSLTKAQKIFTPSWIFSSFKWRNYRNGNTWAVSSILNSVAFNTMEGFVLNFDIERSFNLNTKNRMFINPELRYGYENRKFSAKLGLRIQTGITKKGRFRATDNHFKMEGGDYPCIIGVNNPGGYTQIPVFWNTFYTLMLRENYLNLYKRQFFAIELRRKIANGLVGRIHFNYENRFAMPNVSDYSFYLRQSKEFKPNINFINHSSSSVGIRLSYQIANQYISTPDGKLNLGSKFPLISLNYRRGIPLDIFTNISNRSNYDFIQIALRKRSSLRMLGNLRWIISGGGFFNAKSIELPDYYIPKGNQTIIQNNNNLPQFSLMYYYAYATKSLYAEAHLEHHFDGFIFNKIPLFRKLNFQEVASIRYFEDFGNANPDKKGKRYLEGSLGIENIFKIGRIDFHWRIIGENAAKFGITLNLNLGALFGGGGDDDEQSEE